MYINIKLIFIFQYENSIIFWEIYNVITWIIQHVEQSNKQETVQ